MKIAYNNSALSLLSPQYILLWRHQLCKKTDERLEANRLDKLIAMHFTSPSSAASCVGFNVFSITI